MNVYSFEGKQSIIKQNEKNYLKIKSIMKKEGYWLDNMKIDEYYSALELLNEK